MSGLYSVVHGRHEDADKLMAILQYREPFEPGRFRDAWVEKHGEALVIRVHTRNGGGNREEYLDAIRSMMVHPWYGWDADLDYDNTYADFYFPVPEDSALHSVVEEVTAVEPVDMSQRWQEAIDRMERGEMNPEEIALMEKLRMAFESGEPGIIYVGGEDAPEPL